MQVTANRPKIAVSADGSGIASQGGALLLTQALRAAGLDRGLAVALERWRASRAVHDPGKIIADLVVTLALGGDCLADIAVLRAQPGLFGPVASDPVVSRLVSVLAADALRAVRAIGKARAAARERAWALAGDRAPGAEGALIPVEIGATIVTAHSEKENAAPTWKKTVGFHPDGMGELVLGVFQCGIVAFEHFDQLKLLQTPVTEPLSDFLLRLARGYVDGGKIEGAQHCWRKVLKITRQ